jgi:hypothetical protein
LPFFSINSIEIIDLVFLLYIIKQT